MRPLRQDHLKLMSRQPELAQTGLEIKLNTISEAARLMSVFHRQLPWKTFVPGEPDNGD